MLILMVASENDHVGAGACEFNAPRCLHAPDAWHDKIQQHHIGRMLLAECHSLFTTACLTYHLNLGPRPQERLDSLPNNRVIIY
jgi:hypothetical protein